MQDSDSDRFVAARCTMVRHSFTAAFAAMKVEKYKGVTQRQLLRALQPATKKQTPIITFPFKIQPEARLPVL